MPISLKVILSGRISAHLVMSSAGPGILFGGALGRHPVHCTVCSSVPGYYLADVSNIAPFTWHLKICLWRLSVSLRGNPASRALLRTVLGPSADPEGLVSFPSLTSLNINPCHPTAQNPSPPPCDPLVSGLVSLSLVSPHHACSGRDTHFRPAICTTRLWI